MDPSTGESESSAFAPTGNIMLGAIVILFFVAFFALNLHLYARWYALRHRRRRAAEGPASASAAAGLDPGILESIPVCIFSAADEVAAECAVCLCEFEDGEKVRTLPRCRHGFHVECIDMWFHSHATCPLCRSAVVAAAPSPSAEPVSGSLAVSHNEGSSSGEEALSIEVAARGESGDEEVGSPGGGFKSPGRRVRSLMRLLTRGSPVEPDLERGEAAVATPTPAS